MIRPKKVWSIQCPEFNNAGAEESKNTYKLAALNIVEQQIHLF
jgi:hypothetical protein